MLYYELRAAAIGVMWTERPCWQFSEAIRLAPTYSKPSSALNRWWHVRGCKPCRPLKM
jgi:hypothetical protein